MISVSVESKEGLADCLPIPDVQEGLDLLDLLGATARFLWKDWPRDMQLSKMSPDGNHFTIWGECPHCSPVQSAFETVTGTFETKIDGWSALVAVAQCIACHNFILAAITSNSGGWKYKYHYPLGKPSDSVSEEIPEPVAVDYQEALRCHFVEAYSATVEMCRRAIESGCLEQGAPYQLVLEDMIDWLENQRIITPALKQVAHQVRLGGNRGAHPWKVGLPAAKPIPVIVIEEDHANAVLSFTGHFLEHVYVIPAQLPKYDFSKPKAEKK